MLQGFLYLACAECGNREIMNEHGQPEASADWSTRYLQVRVHRPFLHFIPLTRLITGGCPYRPVNWFGVEQQTR